MGKIVALVGPSACGKSSIEELMWKLNYKRCTSYTTRKPRNNEINGVEYNFITKERFFDLLKNDEILEYTQYRGYFYGLPKSAINLNDGNYVCVVDTLGYHGLKEHFGSDVIGIYICVEDHVRLARLLTRDKDVDKALGRYFADNIIFKEAEKDFTYRVHNNDLQQAVTTIHNLIVAQEIIKNKTQDD